MSKIIALALIVIKELYRRKDFYVLFVLTAVITLAMGSVNFFNVSNVVRDVKEICLLLIWISGLVIALTMTARQIPAERENRTIFPLLAKPVSRGQIVCGKFLGCWLASGASLLVFYFFFTIVSSSREGAWPVLNYFQAFWLQWMMLGVVVALTLLGSVLFTSAAENVTISFVLVASILLLGGHLNRLALQQPQPVQTIGYTAYFLIPHLEWFDVRDFVVYSWPIVPWFYCLLATLYAAAYSMLLLFITWLVFRRKALTA